MEVKLDTLLSFVGFGRRGTFSKSENDEDSMLEVRVRLVVDMEGRVTQVREDLEDPDECRILEVSFGETNSLFAMGGDVGLM